MLLSYNWLKRYLPKLADSPAELSKKLSISTAEVEGIEDQAEALAKVVIGQVLEVEPHPNADRLRLARVDVGNETKLRIVCGALNLEKGQKVPVALIGAKLPNGTVLEKVKIRGEESQGMICSEMELALSDEAEGIMVLEEIAKIGQPFAEYLNLDDAILEIENKTLTHRSDLFSHLGFAREISAIDDLELIPPEMDKAISAGGEYQPQVEIMDPKLCPRYQAMVMTGFKVGPSPEWLQKLLTAVGMRPINNIVDIANFVMLEIGQPIHTFDLDKLESPAPEKPKIIVGPAGKPETLITLDGEERKLSDENLVISDPHKPIALAGIMGGQNTEVGEKTTSILIESANFNPVSIRQTSWKLGLRTEAVIRFEKNLAPALTDLAMRRAIYLYQQECGAQIASLMIDEYPHPAKTISLDLDLAALNHFAGEEIPHARSHQILKSLDFKVRGIGNKIKVTAPNFRTDISIEEDIFEEVTRVFGYENIKATSLSHPAKPFRPLPDLALDRKIRQLLVGFGFTETSNYSFLGANLIKKAGLNCQDHIALQNPLSKDLKYLRTNLLPYLFANARLNLPFFDHFKMFEIGHVYYPGCESKMLAGIAVGPTDEVFYDLKGAVERIWPAVNIRVQTERLDRVGDPDCWRVFAPDRALQFKSGEAFLGTLSLASTEIAKNFKLKKKQLAFFSLSLDQLVKLSQPAQDFTPLPKYPPLTLDLAFSSPLTIPAAEVTTAIKKSGQPLLQKVELFDVYQGEPLPPDKKNLAYHLTFKSPKKTLTEGDVKEYLARIEKNLSPKGLEIRK